MKASCASAMLHVNDLDRALEYYLNSLEFEKEFVYGEPPYYAGVRMDDVVIHLSSNKEGNKRIGMASVYIFCDEVDSYYERIEEREIVITSKLETWPYGMRDFQIKDIDGNHLCFGVSVKSEELNG